jgi:hypothetical protein
MIAAANLADSSEVSCTKAQPSVNPVSLFKGIEISSSDTEMFFFYSNLINNVISFLPLASSTLGKLLIKKYFEKS